MSYSYSIQWGKRPCQLTNNSEFISTIPGPSWSLYNPFDYYGKFGEPNLYMRFANLKDNIDILNFVQLYGFLGVDQAIDLRRTGKIINGRISTKNQTKLLLEELKATYNEETHSFWVKCTAPDEMLEKLAKKLGLTAYFDEWESLFFNNLNFEESLSKIMNESNIINILIKIWQNKLSDEELIIQLNELLRLFNSQYKDSNQYEMWDLSYLNKDREIWDISYTKEDIIRYFTGTDTDLPIGYIGKIAVEKIVNQQLITVNPILKFDVQTNKYLSSWKPQTLLQSLYVMIYLDLIGQKILRTCKNETCGNYFEVATENDRKIYCSNRCASLQAQRAFRIRKGEEKKQKIKEK